MVSLPPRFYIRSPRRALSPPATRSESRFLPCTQHVGSKCSRLAKIFEATVPFARFACPPAARHAVPPPGEDEITCLVGGGGRSSPSLPAFLVAHLDPDGPSQCTSFQALEVPAAVNNNGPAVALTPDRDCTHFPPPGPTEQKAANVPLQDAQLATPSHGGHFRVQFGGEQPVFTSSPVGPWRPLGSAASVRVWSFF